MTCKDDQSLSALSETLHAPSGMDRRTFLMRHAAIGAAAVMTGTTWTPEARAQQAATEAGAQQSAKAAAGGDAGLKMSSALSLDLDVVKSSKGPVMTVADEFYKVGPGPSSSHTIGPMRITYDFYQRWKIHGKAVCASSATSERLIGRSLWCGHASGPSARSLSGGRLL
jgi:L-serine dehydratase